MTCFIVLAIGGWELIVLLAIVLVIFGGRKIPELMKGLGQGIGEFKKGMREGEQSFNDDKNNSNTKKE